MAPNDPKTTTIYGRLSYPTWTHAQAVLNNAKSQFPQSDPTKVSAGFNLILEQAQLDKFLTHVNDVFLPYCLAQSTAGESRDALDAKHIARIQKVFADLEEQPPYVPLKPIPEKTAALAPEGVAMLKVSGPRGADIEQRAIVQNEQELLVPDPDQIIYPHVRAIGQTVHQMYAGCYVAATLNLYAFLQGGKTPGFSASAGVAVFKADGDRFGGGVAVDEDEIFLD